MRKLYMLIGIGLAMVLVGCQTKKTQEVKTTTKPLVTTAPCVDFPKEEILASPMVKGKLSVNQLKNGKNELLLTERGSTDDGISIDVTKQVEGGGSFTVEAEMSFTQKKPTNDFMNVSYEVTTAEDDEAGDVLYTESTRTYKSLTFDRMMTIPKGAKKVVLTFMLQENESADIHVKALRITKEKTDASWTKQYPSLMKLAASYGFKVGTVINANTYKDKTFREVIIKNFNTVSAANEMKAYSMLDQEASVKSAEKGGTEPVLNFETADAMVQWASDHGIKVRGHNLVWDAYMSPWFFNEGYEIADNKVSREVMLSRMESYIKQVVEHFDQKFPGVVYCWDVVNEAIGDSGCYEPDDPCMIRTLREGEENPFYTYVGKDYIKKAFEFARKYASKSTKLFYNDYSLVNADRREGVVNLVKSINKNEKLIDGIGMQCYLDMNESLLKSNSGGDSLVDSVKAFSELGLEVHLTELTVRNYDKQKNVEHGAFYGKLFDTIRRLNKDKTRITNVSIWGIADTPEATEGEYVYGLSGTYYGLLDRSYQPKEAFVDVVRSLEIGNQ